LEELGLLEHIGSNKSGYWKIKSDKNRISNDLE
jgi:hypothetical protein